MTGHDPKGPHERLVMFAEESEECERRRARLQALRERIAAARDDTPADEGDSLSSNAAFGATGQDVGGAERE